MSTTIQHSEIQPLPADAAAEFEGYRAMSTSAVASLALGALSLILFLFAPSGIGAVMVATPMPLLGLLFGLMALRTIARLPGEFAGKPLAAMGVGLSAVALVGSLSFAGYVYATEVPEGYQRISFARMKPSDLDVDARRPIPTAISQLDGKRVFIKGYMRPPEIKNGITSFLLVRDNQECCFGPLNKVQYFDQIQVELAKPLTANYSTRLYRLGGRLTIRPENRFAAAGLGPNRTVYTLVADYLK